MALSPRLRWKLDRFNEQMSGFFGGGAKENPRPKLCPACGTLVGAGATRCHQCGASMTFYGRRQPLSRAPDAYHFACNLRNPGFELLLYGVSLLATIRMTGFQAPAAADFPPS